MEDHREAAGWRRIGEDGHGSEEWIGARILTADLGRLAGLGLSVLVAKQLVVP